MRYIQCGRRGIIPEQNRRMVVFNGVPYRLAVINIRSARIFEIGKDVEISKYDLAMNGDMDGEFGITYNGRIEWLYGHHLTGSWSIRPSGRLILTCHGVQSGYRIDMFRDSENKVRL